MITGPTNKEFRKPFFINCEFEMGSPRSEVRWYKDGEPSTSCINMGTISPKSRAFVLKLEEKKNQRQLYGKTQDTMNGVHDEDRIIKTEK
uniref:Ig-like domain-containing protein n=1 Tax=Romanomermis culicivorax TaxID=13658 RepID=A0A915IUQ8_ROMCU